MITAENHPWEEIYKRDGHIFTEPIPSFSDIAQKFSDHHCERIIDLGCGNGRHVLALRKLNFNTIGFDISRSGLNLTCYWLEKENDYANLVCADTRQSFPFSSNCFDGLISTQVIHHAFLAEIRVTIKEIWRILPGVGLPLSRSLQKYMVMKRTRKSSPAPSFHLTGLKRAYHITYFQKKNCD